MMNGELADDAKNRKKITELRRFGLLPLKLNSIKNLSPEQKYQQKLKKQREHNKRWRQRLLAADSVKSIKQSDESHNQQMEVEIVTLIDD